MSKPTPPAFKDNSVDPTGEFALNVPEYLFYLLFQAIHHRDRQFDGKLAKVGLTIARWRTLAVIRRMGACSMKELSRFSTVERTTLTRSVDQLVADGLIERHIPPDDRRKVLLTLTGSGEATYNLAVAEIINFNRQAVADIPEEEMRRLARTVELVLRNTIPDPAEVEAILRFAR